VSDANAHAIYYTYAYPDRYSDGDADGYGHTNGYSNGHSYTYTDAKRDRTDCLRAQGAGQAHSGSHLERGDLGQHRHLP
jgi:hypothetical protein